MILEDLRCQKEVTWRNPGQQPAEIALSQCPLTLEDVLDASRRLQRFAAFFRVAFPETRSADGLIESELRQIPFMKEALEKEYGAQIPGSLWLKLDSHLPVAGSVKARGGVYEVLKTAEDIALSRGRITTETDYSVFATEEMRQFFSEYSIAVGSTGNLGLSIGIMGAALGFRVTVHMSADARQWKKDLLRSKGVTVVEYESDYSEAVRQGRILAEQDPKCHFVDDENSQTLFLGYAVAALRLQKQLQEQGISVDEKHPLVVYLPCGVGGAPGGIAFGLKLVFGDGVHCVFAEPTAIPAMLLGLVTGKHSGICVQDIGLSGLTCADGLAVGRPSGFVGKVIEPLLTGCYTLSDERMYRLLAMLADSEGIFLEPSALAGMYGPVLAAKEAEKLPENTMHLVWATGGSMVPVEEMEKYYKLGKQRP